MVRNDRRRDDQRRRSGSNQERRQGNNQQNAYRGERHYGGGGGTGREQQPQRDLGAPGGEQGQRTTRTGQQGGQHGQQGGYRSHQRQDRQGHGQQHSRHGQQRSQQHGHHGQHGQRGSQTGHEQQVQEYGRQGQHGQQHGRHGQQHGQRSHHGWQDRGRDRTSERADSDPYGNAGGQDHGGARNARSAERERAFDGQSERLHEYGQRHTEPGEQNPHSEQPHVGGRGGHEELGDGPTDRSRRSGGRPSGGPLSSYDDERIHRERHGSGHSRAHHGGNQPKDPRHRHEEPRRHQGG